MAAGATLVVAAAGGCAFVTGGACGLVGPQLIAGGATLGALTGQLLGQMLSEDADEETVGSNEQTTVEVKTRPTPGRSDNATSQHLIEKDAQGRTISKTHKVTRPDGTVVHQHQEHVGKHGTTREFPDEWVQNKRTP